MTHEERAKEIADSFLVKDVYIEDTDKYDRCVSAEYNCLIETIAEALSSAEKNGREEGKNLLKACESAQHSIWKRVDDAYVDGWNEAIEAAVNEVEMEVICPQEREIRKRIAGKLKALMKNE